MKAFFKYTTASLLMLCYLISIIGISVYHCHCAHSNQIVLLANDDCECTHEHHHHSDNSACFDQCCTTQEADADEHCCSVVVESLKTDQEVTGSLSKIVPDFYFLFTIYQPLTVLAVTESYSAVAQHSPPPILGDNHLRLSLAAQWRL